MIFHTCTDNRTPGATMHFLRVAGFACLALLIGACGESDSTSPNQVTVTGTWTMQTFNGTKLPYAISSGDTTVTITNDVLAIQSNGSYSDMTSFTATIAGNTQSASSTEVGTWTASGGTVTFDDQTDGGVTYQGSVTGNTLTEMVNGTTQVYQRE